MVAGDEEFMGVRVEPGEGVIEFVVRARLLVWMRMSPSCGRRG